MRAISSAQIPAGTMPYGVPTSMSASHTATRVGRIDPDLVAEIASVAGARDRDGHVANRRVNEPEVFQRREIRRRQLLQDRARDAGPGARARRSARRRLRRRRRDRAAFRCSQRAFGSALVRRNVASSRRQIVPSSITLPCASHHGVYSTWPTAHFVTSRVTMRSSSRAASRPGDQVLVERRDVDKRCGIADRGVLAIGMRIVRGRDLISRPASPGLGANQGRGARVERSGEEHQRITHLESRGGEKEKDCSFHEHTL